MLTKKRLSPEDKRMMDQLELECYRKGIIQKPKWNSLDSIKEKNAEALDSQRR